MTPEQARLADNIGSYVFPIATVALAIYLAFSAIQGEYGLFRRFQVEAQQEKLRAELDALQARHAEIANKTRRLSTDSLDLELLDERARAVLGLGRADEIIIR